MVPKDLGLEFEDESEEQERLKREEEAKRKRDANLQSNVDLEFEVPGMEAGSPARGTPAPNGAGQRPQAARPAQGQPGARPQGQNPAARPQGQGQAQAQQQQQRPAENNVAQMPGRSAAPAQGGSIANSLGEFEMNSGRAYSETEVKALIRAAIAECKLEMIAEIASETKELEIKVSRILGALGAKAPPLKKDLMQVQKLVSDHTQLSLKLITPADKKKAA